MVSKKFTPEQYQQLFERLRKAGVIPLTDPEPTRRRDPVEDAAVPKVLEFFQTRPERVFYMRQVEVHFEDEYFHWITNRAMRDLIATGHIKTETRTLAHGGEAKMIWLAGFRYYKRKANELVGLLNRYSDPNITGAVGLHGETMVLEAFARHRFLMVGRHAQEYEGVKWDFSDHNLDFIFERDGKAYGIEVKNTLAYIDKKDYDIKILMCKHLGLQPVFVVRMMPKIWTFGVQRAGGFGLILKWQLYPWTHKPLAKEVHAITGLPVDAPKSIGDGTFARFMQWHHKQG